MGVPGLYGFLVRRFPFIVKPLSEEAGSESPEVDELYVGAPRRARVNGSCISRLPARSHAAAICTSSAF